ncbi:hypothetical protein ACIBCT_21075 [Streptosporangium sp. NPDC050855]|uniref:hypothetical protein n=1 Tax=Streptosporangium sp. NPDC050855 TaxID=3366194 RepID=UPI0037B4193B
MDESSLPPRPPLVVFRDRRAWLRARRKTDTGTWLALIFWDVTVGGEPLVREQWVPFADIARVDGEDYSAVRTLT